jgi:hypothetical protein
LIVNNALAYNDDPNYETNKVICHRARALQDFSYALVKAEMVSLACFHREPVRVLNP